MEGDSFLLSVRTVGIMLPLSEVGVGDEGAERPSVTKGRPMGEHLGSASGDDFGRYGS